jgi:hypothetical protein
MKAAWLLAIVVAPACAAPASAQASRSADQRFENALDECRRTFEDIVGSDEIWVTAKFCELTVGDLGPIKFGATKAGSSLFMQSDLVSYAALYAHSGFSLQPTTDPKTYRLGARTEGQQDVVYLHEGFGGVFSYAHLVEGRATWIRCNQTRADCVYYDDLLEATPVTDRWGREITCGLRWVVSFPAPNADGQVTSYLEIILPFISEFAESKADDLISGCLRPSQRVSGG